MKRYAPTLAGFADSDSEPHSIGSGSGAMSSSSSTEADDSINVTGLATLARNLLRDAGWQALERLHQLLLIRLPRRAIWLKSDKLCIAMGCALPGYARPGGFVCCRLQRRNVCTTRVSGSHNRPHFGTLALRRPFPLHQEAARHGLHRCCLLATSMPDVVFRAVPLSNSNELELLGVSSCIAPRQLIRDQGIDFQACCEDRSGAAVEASVRSHLPLLL